VLEEDELTLLDQDGRIVEAESGQYSPSPEELSSLMAAYYESPQEEAIRRTEFCRKITQAHINAVVLTELGLDLLLCALGALHLAPNVLALRIT
jgi:hypothetical protein